MRRMFSLEQLKGIADSEVKSLVEGGTLNNAKPIYYHGIEIMDTTALTRKVDLTLAILDNDPTPYTFTRLIDWILNKPSAVLINVNGFYDADNVGIVNANVIFHGEANSMDITGNNTSCEFVYVTKSITDWSTIFASWTLEDRVNKIN